MNYATIKYYDIANGPGVRTSVFVSGCRHHCPGCFNAVAWDFDYGQPFDKPTRNEVFASCQPDYIAGLSLLGGEPMEPENQRELLPFVRNFKALYPNKTVWCYSGYTWEQLTGKEPSLARCEAILWKNKHNRKERPVFHFLNGTCGKPDAFFLFYSLLPTASSMMRRKALP